MPSGWNANLPNDVIFDAGVVSHDVATVQTPLFATRGGPNFRENKTNRNWVQFIDGGRKPVAGADRLITDAPSTIEGVSMQIDEVLALLLLPGATKVTVVGPPAVHTITPPQHSTPIAKATLIVKPRLTYPRQGGGSVYWQFPFGYTSTWEPTGRDKDEVEHRFVIESRLDPDAVGFNTDDPDFDFVVIDPTP